jgi:hypothetical protein
VVALFKLVVLLLARLALLQYIDVRIASTGLLHYCGIKVEYLYLKQHISDELASSVRSVDCLSKYRL